MPKITVTIEYDEPADDPFWLNPDNVSTCLQAMCKNTRFNVTWNPITGPDPSWVTELHKKQWTERITESLAVGA